MLIPVRCFTCNHVLADKWEEYKARCAKNKDKAPAGDGKTINAQVMSELGIKDECCRAMFLSTVELINTM